jgi:hypothetical protein
LLLWFIFFRHHTSLFSSKGMPPPDLHFIFLFCRLQSRFANHILTYTHSAATNIAPLQEAFKPADLPLRTLSKIFLSKLVRHQPCHYVDNSYSS